MRAYILDENYESVDMLGAFESLLWVERYNSNGEFELVTRVSSRNSSLMVLDRYLWLSGSENLMIIESIKVETSSDGNRLTVSGRSLESILDRRVIYKQTLIEGNLQDGIQTLLNDNVISPTNSDRAISNVIFEANDDPNITNLTINIQLTAGENLYKAIQEICEAYQIGFKISFVEDTKKLKFTLYSGKDRSYNQLTNPYVVFSPGFNNLLESCFIQSKQSYKNVTLVGGEGEGYSQKTIMVGDASGINRHETYTDASSVSSDTQYGTISRTAYNALLEQKGIDDLANFALTQTFDGQAANTNMYKFGVDYSIGDILQIVNEFGMETNSRVTEIVRTYSTSEYTIYPKFNNYS